MNMVQYKERYGDDGNKNKSKILMFCRENFIQQDRYERKVLGFGTNCFKLT